MWMENETKIASPTQGSDDSLRLPKVDVEYAGSATPDLIPCNVCLPRKEYVFLLDFGHNIVVSLDFLMIDALAADHLAHLDGVRWRALEAHYRIPRRHIALKPLRFHASLHVLEFTVPGCLRMCPAARPGSAALSCVLPKVVSLRRLMRVATCMSASGAELTDDATLQAVRPPVARSHERARLTQTVIHDAVLV